MLQYIRGIFILIILSFSSFTEGRTQSLHPDTLMMKMKDFSQYLLYRNHDTSYIENHADKLVIKLLAISKYNYFKINDKINDSSLRFRPDRKLNLGFGISYKWFALDLAFNLGIAENSDFSNKKSFDFQGTIFSGKHYISGGYQYYYGYQMNDADGISIDIHPSDNIRHDIRTANLTLQYFFAYNYDKFSLKASFIQTEIQKKSAGSVLFGARFNLYTMDADSSVVPMTASADFDEKMHLTSVFSSSIGLNMGYMYTFVWKRNFYATFGLIPGLAISLGDYKTDFKTPLNTQISVGTATMNAIGYNSKKFFCGIQAMGDIYNFKIDKKLGYIQSQGKFKFHVGYRFN